MLKNEELYHLIDLLEMNIEQIPKREIMSKSQQKDAIEYDKKLIELLKRKLK